MLNPWLGVCLVLVMLGGLFAVLRCYQHRCQPHPEVVRKLLHIPMGLLTLSFPWLFDRPLPVLVLGTIALMGLSALRLYSPLRDRWGSVLNGVERRSWGEFYFPIAVMILYLVAHQRPLLFCIPMLILTLADAAAAIVGVRYGRLHYDTLEGQKSAEGSVTFFTIAFFSVHIPLLLLSNTGRAETLLIALILGLLVMLLEAIAWRGLDNLLIPLGSYLLLQSHLAMDVPALATRLGVTIALVGLTLGWRRRTTLTDSAVLAAAFVGYLSWSLGGWQWLMPPLILFLCYPLAIEIEPQPPLVAIPQELRLNFGKAQPEAIEPRMLWRVEIDASARRFLRVRDPIHNVYAVLSVAAAGLLWLFLFGATNLHSEFLYPYTLAFAANLAIIGIAALSPIDYWQSAHRLRVVACIFKGWLLLFVPLLAIESFSLQALNGAAIGLLGTAAAAIAYYLTQPLLRNRQTDTLNWVLRAAYTAIGSLFALIPLY